MSDIMMRSVEPLNNGPDRWATGGMTELITLTDDAIIYAFGDG